MLTDDVRAARERALDAALLICRGGTMEASVVLQEAREIEAYLLGAEKAENVGTGDRPAYLQEPKAREANKAAPTANPVAVRALA